MATLVFAVEVNELMMGSPFLLTCAETLFFVCHGFVSCTHELIAFTCVAEKSFQIDVIVMGDVKLLRNYLKLLFFSVF